MSLKGVVKVFGSDYNLKGMLIFCHANPRSIAPYSYIFTNVAWKFHSNKVFLQQYHLYSVFFSGFFRRFRRLTRRNSELDEDFG